MPIDFPRRVQQRQHVDEAEELNLDSLIAHGPGQEPLVPPARAEGQHASVADAGKDLTPVVVRQGFQISLSANLWGHLAKLKGKSKKAKVLGTKEERAHPSSLSLFPFAFRYGRRHSLDWEISGPGNAGDRCAQHYSAHPPPCRREALCTQGRAHRRQCRPEISRPGSARAPGRPDAGPP